MKIYEETSAYLQVQRNTFVIKLATTNQIQLIFTKWSNVKISLTICSSKASSVFVFTLAIAIASLTLTLTLTFAFASLTLTLTFIIFVKFQI